MFKDFVKQTAGIELIPLISLCVFVAFFVLLFIRVVTYRKAFISEMSLLPLGEDPATSNPKNGSDEEAQ